MWYWHNWSNMQHASWVRALSHKVGTGWLGKEWKSRTGLTALQAHSWQVSLRTWKWVLLALFMPMAPLGSFRVSPWAHMPCRDRLPYIIAIESRSRSYSSLCQHVAQCHLKSKYLLSGYWINNFRNLEVQ